MENNLGKFFNLSKSIEESIEVNGSAVSATHLLTCSENAQLLRWNPCHVLLSWVHLENCRLVSHPLGTKHIIWRNIPKMHEGTS